MWESIKQLLKTDKDKAVLMENGQPRYVILSVEEYLNLKGDEPSSAGLSLEENGDLGESEFPDGNFSQFGENLRDLDIRNASQGEVPIDLSEINAEDSISDYVPEDAYKVPENDAEDITLDDLPV